MDADWNSISAQLHGSFLDRQIRRTNRNLLLTSSFLIVCIVASCFSERRYLYNFFAGPFDANGPLLDSIKDPDEQLRYFMRIRGEDSSDTGLQEIEQETENGVVNKATVKAKHSLVSVGKRLLIVKRNPNDKSPVLEGAVGVLRSDLQSKIMAPFLKEYPNASQAFIPLMVDATDFRTDGYIGLSICLAILLFAGWLARKVVQRRAAPAKHPVVQAVSRYGSLVQTAQQFELELRGNLTKIGKATVTQSWVLLPSAFGLKLCHIPNLIWAYKKVTKHSYNFIPTGKTYDVIMYDRGGIPLEVHARQKKIDAMLNLLAERAPWAVYGYNDQLRQTLEADWGGFIAAVDARRSSALAGKKT